MKFWTLLLCAGLVVGCCGDPIAPELPDNEEENPPVEQPDDPDDDDPDHPQEYPLTDGSIFTVQLNDDIMATVGTDSWNAIAYGNGRYIAVGGSGQIAYSSNGSDWTLPTISFDPEPAYGPEFTDVCWDGNKFVATAVGGYDGFIYTSTDGLSWQRVTSIIDQYHIERVLFFNNMYFFYANYNLWRSSDLQSFTKIDEVKITDPHSIAYGNGRIITLDQNKRSYSLDGISWNELPLSSDVENYTNITFGLGYFWTKKSSSLQGLMKSVDGVDWEFCNTIYSDGSPAYLFNLTGFDDCIFSNSNGYKRLSYSFDGSNWFEMSLERDANAICKMQ